MLLAPGTRLGPYEVLSHLGAGGMGEVYKARDTRLHREVAIKILPPTFASDEDRLRRFRLEAQSASSLNHPNILTVYDIGTTDQSPYIVMELLEGESLGSRLKAGKLGVGRAVDYGKQIAAGLAAAHGKGITHRDIKPDNLFITKDGRVKILDFGLAKAAAGHRRGRWRRPADYRHQCRRRHGHGGVHVARTGARPGGGSALGYLQLRVRAL